MNSRAARARLASSFAKVPLRRGSVLLRIGNHRWRFSSRGRLEAAVGLGRIGAHVARFDMATHSRGRLVPVRWRWQNRDKTE